MSDLRAQERQPCEHAPLDCDDLELPWRCVGCDGHGTRWVTVGALRHIEDVMVAVGDSGEWDRVHAYVIEEET